MNFGSWTDSLLFTKITEQTPIACSFRRCYVLALFQHIWCFLPTPGKDENTRVKQVLVRFTSWKGAITSESVSLWICDAKKHIPNPKKSEFFHSFCVHKFQFSKERKNSLFILYLFLCRMFWLLTWHSIWQFRSLFKNWNIFAVSFKHLMYTVLIPMAHNFRK
jgi:hypothetical protein